ncbi:ABC transporter ATP-binding protein [Aerococcus urinaeequi]|uniref:ABC transporter ATP-binding protein n=1 Tax=Aerococcus urinaeequi TaxID=51665 RepID=UPI003D6BC257
MENIIYVDKLSKNFSDNKALDGISFSIKKGTIFGFLGPSGSGKTTTIKILTNQLRYDSGYVTLFGKNIDSITGKDLSKIGILSDDSGTYEKLTLRENLELYARLFNKEMKKIDILLKEVDLYQFKKTKVKDLSKGMKQRMLLVRALINNPEILFLDEPTSGLDPSTSKKIHNILNKLRSQGVTIFLTTHDMKEATKLCNELVFLFNGKIIEQGSPADIIKKYSKELLLKITYKDNKTENITFNTLCSENSKVVVNNIISVHSQEPSLEDVFIELTGAKLNDE